MRIDDARSDLPSADGMRIAVVTASFNDPITSGLRRGAVDFLEEVGAAEILAVDVPGSFELPLFAQRFAQSGFDAVICLGAVIEGETDHYEHVAHRASEGLMRVQLDTGVPIAFGILTVRDVAAATLRSGPGDANKGREAADAAVRAVLGLRELTANA